MFNQLMSWYTGDRYERTFCEFIHESDVHLFEKLSFLQKYVFDNEDFTDADTSTEITNWYPSRFDTSNAEKCLPNIVTNCRCQVITKGTNKATPGATDLDSVAILPKIVQKVRRGGGDKTFIDRFEAGAAKYVALRQNEGAGGSSYEMSNMKDGDDATSVTSEASEIQFFLACLNRGTGHDQGGGTTNLPDSCDCKRPLYVSYEYTTNLYIKTEKKGCITNQGAGAQAEELALVVAYHGRDGSMTPLAAGKYGIGKQCSSSWNVQWWLNLLDVAGSVLGYYVTTLDTNSNNIPTQNQIDDFLSALDSLIGTPFINSSGSCGELEQQQVLISGENTLTLLPNEPIRIALMSAYYVRTNGYGCYRSEAAVASDYYLVGVVESELTENPECCSDKFGTYLVGSRSYPDNGDVQIEAINTVPNRLTDVGCYLSTFGKWDGYEENPHTGCTQLLYEFTLLRGPSCTIDIPRYKQDFQDEVAIAGKDLIDPFPTIVYDEINLRLNSKDQAKAQIALYDMVGNVVGRVFTGDLEVGVQDINFPVQNLVSGVYILHCNIDGANFNFPIMILK